jgi:hypothetical protein
MVESSPSGGWRMAYSEMNVEIVWWEEEDG